MSVQGVLLSEDEETITVMTGKYTINIKLNWEKREVTEITHSRTIKPKK